MKILAADTSTNVAAAAITDGERLIGEYILNHKKTHSQKLMVIIDELMQSTQTDINDIELFAVVVGPGSFTGLRIGIAAMKTLAHVTNKPVAQINTLEALSYNLPMCPYYIVPMLDARRRDVFTAVYKNGAEIKAPCAETIDECVEFVKSLGGEAVFLGDAVLLHKELIQEKLGGKAHFVPANLNEPRASSAAACALDKYNRGEVCRYDEAEPVYIRKSQAEREYDEKHGK